jgi:chromosome segregation ATPase
MTPADLLTQMQSSFEAARDALADIDGAESTTQTELAQLHSEYASLDARASRIKSATERPSFVELQGLQADPLNARAGMASIGRGLAAWATMLDRLESSQAQASAGLARAKTAVAELRGLSTAWQASAQQVQMLLGAAGAQSLTHAPTDQLSMLESWCDTLEGSLKVGQWDAVNVGLSRIEVALDEALTRGKAAVAEAQARCAEVEEMKGQFTALKAKERALSAQLRRDVDSEALRERISLALAARPLDVAATRAWLKQYQNLLLTLSH